MNPLAEHIEIISNIVENNRTLLARISKLKELGYSVEQRWAARRNLMDIVDNLGETTDVKISCGIGIHDFAWCVILNKEDIMK